MNKTVTEALKRAESANNGVIDRFATKYFPTMAARRAEARFSARQSTLKLAAIEAASSSYKGANKSRTATKGWNVTGSDPDSEMSGELQDLRERARDMERNNAIASGAIKNVKMYVVGDRGPKLNAQIDGDVLGLTEDEVEAREKLIQMEWDLFFNNKEFDVERSLSGPDFMTQTIYNWFTSGDVFTVRSAFSRKGSPYKTKWQNIEADLCTNPDFIGDGESPNVDIYPEATGLVYSGVEKDAKTKEPVAYYFQNKFALSSTIKDDLKWTRVPAYDRSGRQNVIHLFIKDRPKQSRGVPYLTPILESLKQLDRYTDSELMAAVTSGLFSVFVTSKEGRQMSPIAGSTQSESKDDSIEMGYGNIVSLKEGETVESQEPGRPNPNYDPFFTSIVKQIGVALGQPVEILLKSFESSYSASRAAMLEAWRYFTSIRGMVERNWLAQIYELYFEEAVATDRVPAMGFISGDYLIKRAWTAKSWTWPPQGMIRPEVEIKAVKQAEEAGYITKETATATVSGGDYGRNYPQRLKEAEKERAITDISEPINEDQNR